MLDLEITAKRHGDRPVLGPLRLRLEAGERVALMGPSGVGKSTLLTIAAGLDRRFEGQRHIGPGRLGMVFQEPRLLPWRSVLDNLLLCDPPGGLAECRHLLAAVGLGEWADAWPGQLSLGMQRRVAVARAFCVRPALVLLDEPFASLDAATADVVRALVDGSGAALLLATHDAADAARFGARVVRLEGAPARLVEQDGAAATPPPAAGSARAPDRIPTPQGPGTAAPIPP